MGPYLQISYLGSRTFSSRIQMRAMLSKRPQSIPKSYQEVAVKLWSLRFSENEIYGCWLRDVQGKLVRPSEPQLVHVKG